ncbi:hypothetical protein M758_1G222400 [Ceratodon purpureus]|uniref:Peptide-N(4)-(N-acetyl-beta-glucosaminyl)asparagine amidase n=1 Tax=Ceratodon purpureus TaxID=3225 RepID=A0A8T0J748_CERPU|nr:hypothetical protein KC19_1G197100 [Ceratodon purpureus]KAG0631037.1 hypothetical protein M758_1G222400 [Ceratodon purpureus]
MVLHKLSVIHDGQSHAVDYDSDEGEEVLKVQLFSVTNVLPEYQNFSDLTEIVNGLHSLTLIEVQDGMYTLKALGGNGGPPVPAVEPSSVVTIPLSVQSDEELARALQAEEDALSAQQQWPLQSHQHGRAAFQAKLESYMLQVMLYEDMTRQNAARASVSLEEMEEKALVALARQGKATVSDSEKSFAVLVQLLLWFKKSFRWVNEPDCDSCGSKSARIGMGTATSEELRHGANRVELFRCTGCRKEVRFPRYNDPMKLLETRAGRCGEWANCFTLYCRAFGYEARLALDFTDHVWTECFSPFHNRWVHFDPCEAAYDKPLLYESGWKKRLSYVIALANDGAYDVTRRYTRKWSEVLTRRTEVTEAVVQEVVFALTARARLSRPAHELEVLRIRDNQEREELLAGLAEEESASALPGRQSGSQQWRMLRGEVGSMSPSLAAEMINPVRACVDEHVKEIMLALGELLKSSEPIRVTNLWVKVLQKLQSQPYKVRRELFGTKDWLKEECSSPLLQAVGLQRDVQESGRVLIQLAGSPVKTALALPVAIEQLVDLHQQLERIGESNIDQRVFSNWTRLAGGTSCASGELPPFEIASAAFDGLNSTKWLDENGATSGWIEYRLPDGKSATLVGYQITSANDAPERDPQTWLVEGSETAGQTWRTLDSRQGEHFEARLMKKCYEIDVQKSFPCRWFRFLCLSVRDAANSRTPLQIANIDYFSQKSE